SRALDPQLHTHVVVMNISEHQERGFRALQPIELYRSQELGTRIYYTELAKGLKQLGYEIEIGKSNGQPEIAGKTDEYLAHFSQRSEEIKKHLKDNNLEATFYNRFNAAHETREEKKKDISKENLISWWKSRAENFEVNEKENVQNAVDTAKENKQSNNIEVKKEEEIENKKAVKEGVQLSIDHNLERNSIVEERELLTKALDVRHHLGKYTIDDVKKEMTELLEKKELLQEQTEQGTRYTTKEMQDLEKENIAIVEANKNKFEKLEELSEVREQLRNWEKDKSEEAGINIGLNFEQKKAAERVLTTNDQVIGIQGRAGVGKSFLLSFVKSEADRNGIEFRAFTPTTKAAENLRGEGIEADTVAKLKAELKGEQIRKGGVWVIDEAGMVDARSMNTILKGAEENNTRVILVGDTQQHGSVGAGRALDQLIKDANLEKTEVSEIVRQKEENFRGLVKDLSQGQTENTINRVKSVGNVYEIRDEKKQAGKTEYYDCSQERYKKAAELYINSSQRGETLVVAPTNYERRGINEAIRTELKKNGQIAKEGMNTEILVNKNITGAERKLAQNYKVGDKVGYLYGSEKHGIEPGEYLKVSNVDIAKNEVTVMKDNGVIEVTYNPKYLYGIKDVYTVDNREFSAGDKIFFKEKNKDFEISSGTVARVEQQTTPNELFVRLENGKSHFLKGDDLKHAEHAYAMTSHKAQGTTVDNVIVYIDDKQQESMVNKTMAYVAISRARSEVSIITNDEIGAQKAINREYKNEAALDLKAVEENKIKENKMEKSNNLSKKNANDITKEQIRDKSLEKSEKENIEVKRTERNGFDKYKIDEKELSKEIKEANELSKNNKQENILIDESKGFSRYKIDEKFLSLQIDGSGNIYRNISDKTIDQQPNDQQPQLAINESKKAIVKIPKNDHKMEINIE
ncbi:MAG: AAA family ATPase, partial [Thaumarchaeota archaeon]|nr:AAA family ATPase [Nitrososphaerota archaeon]